MESKSCCFNTVEPSASAARMRNKTYPFDNAVKGCIRSEFVKTGSKRKSLESLEGPEKRSRIAPISASESVNSRTDLSMPARQGLFGHEDVLSLSLSLTESSVITLSSNISESSVIIVSSSSSGKRKSTEDEAEEVPRKRSRGPDCEVDHQTSNPLFSGSDSARRAVFEAKYEEQQLLGRGGFGAVYAGIRRADNVPVAIKHISGAPVRKATVIRDGKQQRIPLEVALLEKFPPSTSGSSAVVALLDWFDLGEELILVLERPVPCMDLDSYVDTWGSYVPEHQAKVITKQLLDALIEIESRGVFHRDIKLENILVETGSDVPRVRIIDFGCGTLMKEGFYTAATGTFVYMPPEFFLEDRYQASQTSVWQLGVVLYALVHGRLPFNDALDVIRVNPGFSRSLSISCQSFLKGCLSKDPETRSTLESLKDHPWLR